MTPSGRDSLRWGRGILATVWVLGLLFGLLHVRAEWRLLHEGQVALVRVENLEERRGGKGTSRVVEYTLAVPGYTQHERESVENGWFWQAGIGGLASVTYLPQDPAVHQYGRVGSDDVSWAVRQSFLITLVASVIPFVIFAGVENQMRRESAMLRRGVLVDATVLSNGRDGKTGRNWVKYEYRLDDGTRRYHTLILSGSGGERLAVGATLPILYLPEESFESVPLDEVKMVRLAPRGTL